MSETRKAIDIAWECAKCGAPADTFGTNNMEDDNCIICGDPGMGMLNWYGICGRCASPFCPLCDEDDNADEVTHD